MMLIGDEPQSYPSYRDIDTLVECFAPGGGDCTITGCCRLKARLRSAEAAFLTHLNDSTLADIALPLPESKAA